jgi:ABC-type multidrug transport system permease subunit
MPAWLRVIARVNPVSYAVDLTRRTLGQPAEFDAMPSVVVLLGTMTVAFIAAALLFDPEQRFVLRTTKPRG